jgi:hypothetical protein
MSRFPAQTAALIPWMILVAVSHKTIARAGTELLTRRTGMNNTRRAAFKNEMNMRGALVMMNVERWVGINRLF